MGLRARRESEKMNMRILILEAASQIVIEAGYEKLSIRKIADAINYSPTVIYTYYKNKAQIIEDISKKLYEDVICEIKKHLDNNIDLPTDKKLKVGFKVFINSMTSRPEMGKAVCRSGTGLIFSVDEKNERPEDDGIMVLQELLSEGQRQGILRKLDDNASWMIITALLGFVMNALENQLYLCGDWNEMLDVYTEIIVNGLLKQ